MQTEPVDVASDYRNPAGRVYRRRRGPGRGVYLALVIFLVLALAIITSAALLAARDRGTLPRVNDSIAERLRGVIAAIPSLEEREPDPPPAEQPATPFVPTGDQIWVLTEDELNQRIVAGGGQVGSARDVRLELDQDRVTIHFTVYGIPGAYSGNVVARDGMPYVTDTSVGGPLGLFVATDEIDAMLNAELHAAVQEQNVSVDSVQVQPGQLVFGVSATEADAGYGV
jgi:hypothetical protein